MELTKYQKIAVKAALFSLVENQVINHEQFDELIRDIQQSNKQSAATV